MQLQWEKSSRPWGRFVVLLGVCVAMAACGTLSVTPELQPNVTGKPIPAKVGVHVSGEALKKVFLDSDRASLGMGPGQLFSDVVILPPETRYLAPQDIMEQFGTDLILQVQVVDTKTNAEMNPLFFAAMPMMWFEVFAPIMTYETTVSLEANLRDGRTGRLLWAKTEQMLGTDHFSPINPEEKIAGLAQRGMRNAVVKLLETLPAQVAAARSGAPAEAKVRPKAVPSQASPDRKNHYAVVIGVEQYRERLPKADFAVSDAKAMAEFLTKAAGYPEENVILRLNEQATKSDLDKYLEPWLKNHLDASSSLFVYFSGHGTPQTTTGEAYLVPYDGDPAFIEQTGYPLKRLYETLEKLPAREIVVMLDSCFSGAGGRSVLAKGAKPMGLTMEALSFNSRKTVVLTATSGNHISMAYQEKGHGLFTFYALQGLEGDADANGDGAIDVSELYEYLRPQVQRVARRVYNTEQVPQLLGPPGLLDRSPLRIVERGR